MVGGYSNTSGATENKRRPRKGPDQRGRRMIQAMLSRGLAKKGYKISRFLAGKVLKVTLGTQNPFAGAGFTNDECWLKLLGMNIYGFGQRKPSDQIIKIATVADPKCVDKVVQYVLNSHADLLKKRTKLHSEYLDTIGGALDKMSL